MLVVPQAVQRKELRHQTRADAYRGEAVQVHGSGLRHGVHAVLIPEEPTPDYNEHEIAAKRQKTDDIEAPDCPVCCEKFSGNSEIYHF